jgi:hypothetical protein
MQSRKSQKNAVTISQKAFTTATKQISHDSQKSVTTVDSAVDRGFNRRAGGMSTGVYRSQMTPITQGPRCKQPVWAL